MIPERIIFVSQGITVHRFKASRKLGTVSIHRHCRQGSCLQSTKQTCDMHHKRIKAAHTVTITDIRKHEPLVSRTNKKIHLRDNSISSRNCCAKTGEAMLYCRHLIHVDYFHPLKPNDPYSGRTAPLTSESCILYI